ncbi:multicopper oxidase [Aspergillus piperis CBS 112811]|uniref:Multicopper oxidase n=1 Tax=Aspergillus piperis CBS 112811 TaxID=1448313 RepID=A0A8G1VMH3_9EURO|nr:multicopper oxidase [Aspergillus piperis CBS 112811]RAH58849.1 multicopper oxidase [Aspergillus piperis CBS 112811]
MVYWQSWFLLLGTVASFNPFESQLPDGLSPYGLLPTSSLGPFLHSNGNNQDQHSSLEEHPPWKDISPSGGPPDTGVTRHYNFTITRDTTAPDGYQKSGILINGQFPGPLIEANWGDMISVTVNNMITTDTAEGLTLHWHGLTQAKTPWEDGVPGITQCPIAPGGSFTYTFQADQYGTSWYHSHYSAQYTDGAYGPMIIHGPVQPEASYDYDLGPVIISDYSHLSYFEVLESIFSIPPVFPNVDNNLINGRGAYNCNSSSTTTCSHGSSLSRFNFSSGKTHRLRLMNTGSNANQKFTIDNHTMTVIANDFVPVHPYTTDVVTLGVGQRTDVIVTAAGNPTDSYWMRASIDMTCLNATASIPTVKAAIYYEHADTATWPTTTTTTTWESNNCANDPLNLTVPYYPQTPPSTPATTQTIEITLAQNTTGHTLFYINNSTFRSDYNTPLLLLDKSGNFSDPDPDLNVYNFGSNSSVRLIIYNLFSMQHPLHLHGHNYWVLAQGRGTWDGVVTNPMNPQRRDTQIIQPGTEDSPAYVVLEWQANNPGVWPLHCHMSWHVSVGLLLNVVERPDDIERLAIPESMAQTCRDWTAFSNRGFVDEIDSGV